MSKVRSIRATADRWELWALAAAASNMSLNAWMAQSCDLVAARDLAERRRIGEELSERERLRAVMSGQQTL